MDDSPDTATTSDATEPAPTPAEPSAPAPRRRQRRIVDVDGDVALLAERVERLEGVDVEKLAAAIASKIVREALAGVTITVVDAAEINKAMKARKTKKSKGSKHKKHKKKS